MRPIAVFRQNGLDTDDGIENVGAGVALEGGEALQIEVVILGGLVAEIAVFQGGKGDFRGGGVHFGGVHDFVFHDFCPDEGRHIGDEGFQTENAAVPGLEGLAVLAVHGAVADMLQSGGVRDNAALPGGAEHLLKV